jgi:hypothetical protein
MPSQIKVVGLRELRRGLKEAEGRSPKELTATNKAVAEMLVAPAKGRMAGHSPRAGSQAIGTIRALASATRAQLAGGSNAVPWYAGHEWGSIKYHQFPTKNPDGYALYPTIEAERGRIVEKYAEMLDKLTREAFPN